MVFEAMDTGGKKQPNINVRIFPSRNGDCTGFHELNRLSIPEFDVKVPEGKGK